MTELKKESEVLKNQNLLGDKDSAVDNKIPERWLLERDSLQAGLNYNWIEELKDNRLEELIQEGWQYNSDLLIAEQKLNQIEIAMGIAEANLFPSVNAIAGSNTNLQNNLRLSNVNFKANWELDIWGKNKAGAEAAKRDYFSAKYIQTQLKQSIAALIAKAYYLTISTQVQQQKANEYLALTQELKSITELRRKVGTANDIDVSNANAEIILLQSKIEQLNNASLQAKRSLELLLGRFPQGAIDTKSSFPAIQNPVPESLPLQLLENRPDILAMHYQLEKAFLEVQQAKAARLPSLNLSSSFGVASSNVGVLNSLFSNPVVNVGGGLVSPIFNGGKLKKNVEIKNAQQQQLVEEYAKQVLNALNEVETAWANLDSYEKQFGFYQSAIAEFNRNIALTQKQIQKGTNNNYTLFLKQRDLIRSEMQLIDLQLRYIIERINLYMAIGAGN